MNQRVYSFGEPSEHNVSDQEDQISTESSTKRKYELLLLKMRRQTLR